MSARIAEARRLLRDVQSEYSTDAKPEYTSDADSLAAAQVEATLAVAEQLRLGNLIALHANDAFLPVTSSRDIGDELTEYVEGEQGLRTSRLRPKIAALLGISTKTEA